MSSLGVTMFTAEELRECMDELWFRDGHRALERSLLEARLGIEPVEGQVLSGLELERFSQAVLASVGDWDDPRSGDARDVCRAAADVEAAIAAFAPADPARSERLFHAALLYDLAGMPGTAASYAQRDGLPSGTVSYLARLPDSLWGVLGGEASGTNGPPDEDEADLQRRVHLAIGEALAQYGAEMQGTEGASLAGEESLRVLDLLAADFDLGVSRTTLSALRVGLELRQRCSTLRLLADRDWLERDVLRSINAPTELWPVQTEAIRLGLLDPTKTSFGLAAPTGTGKTALTRILISDFLGGDPTRKVLYVVPSRALSSEVARALSGALKGLGIRVLSLGGTLTVTEQRPLGLEDADVLVFTPEKADLLLRLEPDVMGSSGLIIVDEAHHIEQGTRGVLLEFYLWRLRQLVPPNTRVVQLSAVTPNIGELVGWLGDEGDSVAAKIDWRASPLRVGWFERLRGGAGAIQFPGDPPFRLFDDGTLSAEPMVALATLVDRLSTSGIVLALCTSPGQAEKLAEQIASLREDAEHLSDDVWERLDARVERELYPDSPLRDYYRRGVLFHHAQLPPRVREAVEAAIRERRVDVICATTTLAEGVNFPFSTVVVESLVGRNYELTPRSLWNIAGRAGRFGVDSEGHCILFRPSQWEKKLKHHVLSDYMQTGLDGIPPVRSALAAGLEDLKDAVAEGLIDEEALEAIDLAEITIGGKATQRARALRGLLNVIRVGYAHASESGLADLTEGAAPEFDEALLLGARQIPPDTRAFASKLGRRQRAVIARAVEDNEQLLRIAARVGWSLETQSELYRWLRGRDDWQLEQYGGLVRGGRVRSPETLGYLIGPITTRMTEFEGETLGGQASFVATQWIQGLPLTAIREAQKTKPSFGRLVRMIYTKVQYMLPWALFGMHELLKYEARRRGLRVGSGVSDLSALASEGVPSFSALDLILHAGLERVDAARLSTAYDRSGSDTEVVAWFGSQDWNRVVGVVRGADRRRLDPDLRHAWEHAGEGSPAE